MAQTSKKQQGYTPGNLSDRIKHANLECALGALCSKDFPFLYYEFRSLFHLQGL